MKTQSQKHPYKPTLVEFEMVEITDPAEQAALDRRCREAAKLLAARQKTKPKPRKRK